MGTKSGDFASNLETTIFILENTSFSGGRAISEARGLADYFARDSSGSSGGSRGSNLPNGFKQSKKFGYQHGQKVYEYKGKYYSRDIDGHNGGSWKVFEEIGGKLKRIGTTDNGLNIFKD